jgi:hemerythrin-like domain-containing protein
VRDGSAANDPTPAVPEAPLDSLWACHRRLLQQCESLRRLVAQWHERGADPSVREAAAAVMRTFDSAAHHHHADEELDVFPALIEAMAGSDAVCLRELTAALTAEHRELQHRWRALRPALERAGSGDAAAPSADDVDAFVALYQRHIAREEAELLPMAQRLLADDELQRIGSAMRERRQHSR